MSKIGGVTMVPVRSGWRQTVAAKLRWEKSHSRVFGGSIIMLLGTAAISGVNFAFNVAMARMLGPSAFGHVTAVVTLLMLASAINLAFQLVCAKFIAKNGSPEARGAAYAHFLRRSWMVGLGVGAAMIAAAYPLAHYLRLPSPWALVILGLGIAFYVPLGVKRGGMQGTCDFPRLTWNFIIEAVAKLVTAVVLVTIGYGVLGAVGALSVSVVAAYYLPRFHMPGSSAARDHSVRASFREGMQAIVFFVGQVIINNIDIVLVKHFFDADAAGMYAAVALVGRVLYFAAWSVVSAMFPVTAGGESKQSDSVVLVPLGFVTAISVSFILLVHSFPSFVIGTIFGARFHQAEPLLALYAAATGLYALSVVLMTYEMSRKIANTGWLQLIFSGVLVVAITLFHSTLREVVVVQIVLMVALLVLVAFPFLRRPRRPVQLTELEGAA